MGGTYDISNPFSVFFNMMKMRYADMDESLTTKNFFQYGDRVNIFISMETIIKMLTTIPELERRLRLNREFPIIIISDILNLAGHYKRFFVNNGFDTRIYFYSTSLDSDDFPQRKYNEDFRSYYLVKYNDNPKFVYFTEAFKTEILPQVKTYCDFIPGVYYLEGKNLDGSIIPYLIATEDATRKNLVISGELFETQYAQIPGFLSYVISISSGVHITSSTSQFLQRLIKKEESEIQELIRLYSSSHSIYTSLLSILEDRMRCVNGLNGVGPRTLERYLNQGLERNEITINTRSPEIIGEVFHDEDTKDEFVNNFYCLSVPDMCQEVTSADKMKLLNQRMDRYDMNSLQMLNATTFYKHQIRLENLC